MNNTKFGTNKKLNHAKKTKNNEGMTNPQLADAMMSSMVKNQPANTTYICPADSDESEIEMRLLTKPRKRPRPQSASSYKTKELGKC